MMRFIAFTLIFFAASSALASEKSSDIINVKADLNTLGLAEKPDSWFSPKNCEKDSGEYLYISIGEKDKAVFKMKRSLIEQISPQGYNISQPTGKDPQFELQKNTGCPENPLHIFRALLLSNDLIAKGFILSLATNRSHGEKLAELRDGGTCSEKQPELLHCTGKQSIGGIHQPVEYYMAKDPKDLLKAGGPFRVRCLLPRGKKICSMIDAVNSEVDYQGFSDDTPTLEHLHKVHDQLEDFVKKTQVLK